jgi:protein gp37
MAQDSKIEWTHATFNPWRGCTKVSDGCKNCYADTLSKRNPRTLGVWGPNGTRVAAAESYWREPVKWDREAAAAGVRRRVFCASLADVFEDWRGGMRSAAGDRLYLIDGEAWQANPLLKIGRDRRPLTMSDVRRRLLHLIRDTPNLDWLLLTKRPENVGSFISEATECTAFLSPYRDVWPNLWLGTSVEDQAAADARRPRLRKWEPAVRFLSCEPLLGPAKLDLDGIHWVIVGGESGPNARPMHPDWARSIRDQCVSAGVPFFFKQWGEWLPDEDDDQPQPGRMFGPPRQAWPTMRRVGKKAAGRQLDGRTWDEFPAGSKQPATL